jgi:hypothetical protein
MKKTDTNIQDFLESVSQEGKADMQALHKIISKAASDREIVMYEGKFWGGSDQKIIGYGEWSYKRSDRKQVDWFMVGLAKQKNYITVFVNAVEDNEYVAEKYKDELGKKVKVGKSSISFKSLDDVDLEVLENVVKKAFR